MLTNNLYVGNLSIKLAADFVAVLINKMETYGNMESIC